MIIIATHKDFNYDGRFKNACIIDGHECVNDYIIPVYHEDDHPTRYTGMHDSYAELSRLYYFFSQFGESRLRDVCGLQQYKRMFKLKEEELPSILDKHGVILPTAISQHRTVADAYGRYHRKQEIDWVMKNVPRIFPEYKKDVEDVLNGSILYPHNIFMMKKDMFIKYFNWLFKIFDALNRDMNWKTMADIRKSGIVQNKTHGCLSERVSNIFYHHHFPNPYTGVPRVV